MLSADPGQVSRPQFRRPARAKFPLPAHKQRQSERAVFCVIIII